MQAVPREAAKSQLYWPKPVVVGTATNFTYVIKAETLGALRSLRSFEEGSEQFPVQASRMMEVTLSGGAFKIDPAGPVRKDLGTSNSGSWTWSVTPLEPGKHTVSITVTNLQADASGSLTPMPATDPDQFQVIVTAREMKWNETLRFWLTDWNSTAGILTKFVGSLTLLLAAIVGLRTGFRRLMRGEDALPAAKGTK